MKSILVIDDSSDFRETTRWILNDAGYEVWEAGCPAEAYPILEKEEFDLILCDLHMPFAEGPEREQFKVSCEVGMRTVKELSWVYPDLPIAVLSSASWHDLQRLSRQLDPVPAFTKPKHWREMVELVEILLAIPQNMIQ